MSLEAKLKVLLSEKIKIHGLSHFGWSPLQRPLTIEHYKKWISEEKHGEMKYLETHLPIKEAPQKQWPSMKTALLFAAPYFPKQSSDKVFPLQKARISLYAQNADYHQWFREKLSLIAKDIQNLFPETECLSFTDSVPLLERDLALRSGLGWQGKNSCVIHPQKGSLFFLGEILTNLNLAPEHQELHDFCGKCTRCIDHCPTGAIEENRTLDARKCISYWTIESRSIPPENLREKFYDHFFGCDLCQTVCPWNQKIFKDALLKDHTVKKTVEDKTQLSEEMQYILESSGKKLQKDFLWTPLQRAGSFGLKRNALIVVGNENLKSCEDSVNKLLSHPKLGTLAHWTLKKLYQTQ